MKGAVQFRTWRRPLGGSTPAGSWRLVRIGTAPSEAAVVAQFGGEGAISPWRMHTSVRSKSPAQELVCRQQLSFHVLNRNRNTIVPRPPGSTARKRRGGGVGLRNKSSPALLNKSWTAIMQSPLCRNLAAPDRPDGSARRKSTPRGLILPVACKCEISDSSPCALPRRVRRQFLCWVTHP